VEKPGICQTFHSVSFEWVLSLCVFSSFGLLVFFGFSIFFSSFIRFIVLLAAKEVSHGPEVEKEMTVCFC